jgi:hypothetical protein
MAVQLKLERRLHPRIKFPVGFFPDFTGPKVFCGEHPFAIVDISEGGLCLQDTEDRFNGMVGKDVNMRVEIEGSYELPVRIVGSNLQKRHIQFLEAPESVRKEIRDWVQCGLRGQWLNALCYDEDFQKCPILWSSLYDDSLFVSSDPRWSYSMGLEGEVIHLGAEFWPVYENLTPISVRAFDRLLVCLENLHFRDPASEFLKEHLPRLRRRSFE